MSAPTLSALSLIAACPGAASLPRAQRVSRAASLGTAIHELIETMIAPNHEAPLDVDAEIIALAHGLAPDDAGRLGFLAEHLRLPVPRGALAEVPLGYWLPERDAEVTPGTVRRIEGGAGVYPDVGQALSGTIDAMWSEPTPLVPWDSAYHVADCDETLWVCDFKAGDEEYVTPLWRGNWQLRGAAVMAARWTGARRVIPAICYINAAECAAAVREGRVYTGRWEVGAPLDGPALDAIERGMRAVLARARGEGDAEDELASDPSGERAAADGAARGVRVQVDAPDGAGSGRTLSVPRLILGPHCDHCPARGACPALAAEAVTLARAEGLYLPPGGALTRDAAARLVALLGPARRVLDAIEVAVRAHVKAHGPLRLASGQEYGPELEATTRYITGPTFDALSAVVGEERAQGAFEATGASLKRALEDEPRGAWRKLRAEIEARGGVVTGAREVFRVRWPAKPAEVSDEPRMGADDDARRREGLLPRVLSTPDDARRRDLDSGSGQGDVVPDARGGGGDGGGRGLGDAGAGDGRAVAPLLTRAPCPVCHVERALTRKGVHRKHPTPGSGSRCPGSGAAPSG